MNPPKTKIQVHKLIVLRAHVDVQDRAMQVLQGRSRLRVMPVSGAVCQPRAPDSTGRNAEQGVNGGKGDREAQTTAGKSEVGTAGASNAASVTRESGKGEYQEQVGQEHGVATRGGRGDGGI